MVVYRQAKGTKSNFVPYVQMAVGLFAYRISPSAAFLDFGSNKLFPFASIVFFFFFFFFFDHSDDPLPNREIELSHIFA